jgi:hypothetical protein
LGLNLHSGLQQPWAGICELLRSYFFNATGQFRITDAEMFG